MEKQKIKIRFIKDLGVAKIGDISLNSESDADDLVKDGFAEVVIEDNLQEKKIKLVEDTRKMTQEGVPNLMLSQNKDIAIHIAGISPENYEKIIKEKGKVTLKQLHDIYKNLLYVEDTKRIDIVLATALSQKLPGVPIWLIMVGPSGDMKSVQLNAIDGFNTHYLQKLTSKTLVNGFIDKSKHPDLAPKLNGEIVVIRDMAPLLKLNPAEKGEVWGQLRDLYDGFAGTASGQGVDVKYEGIKVTLLAASTPAIDGQILVHQDLGTRELLYRTNGSDNRDKVMDKCLGNESCEEDITKKLREITVKFLKDTEIVRNEIPANIISRLKEIAMYTRLMRASADLDSFENSLRCNVYPEEPTRILKQLKRLYICLMSLSDDYSSEEAIEILWKIGRSSAFQTRVEVLDYLLGSYEEKSTSAIAEALRKGKSTMQRELAILWNMRLVHCRKEETTYPDRFYDYWTINRDDEFVQSLIKLKEKPSNDITQG